MFHRKVISQALETLKGEWADCFHRVILRLKEDPRTAGMRNLVYLKHKDVIPYLPIYLAPRELADALIDCLKAGHG